MFSVKETIVNSAVETTQKERKSKIPFNFSHSDRTCVASTSTEIQSKTPLTINFIQFTGLHVASKLQMLEKDTKLRKLRAIFTKINEKKKQEITIIIMCKLYVVLDVACIVYTHDYIK